MTKTAASKLTRNPKLLFWTKALKNVKVLSIVSALFYLHRGLSLSQIFYLSIVWAITNLVFEIPSSYMADKWGRKKTLFIGAVSFLFYWVFLFFGANFWVFTLATFMFAFSFACFSGTDDALLYDTKKELNKEHETLDSFGKYYSAKRVFKVITPIIGAVIAKDLMEWQFQLIIGIDIFASVVGIILTLFLVEPPHYKEVKSEEADILLDAWNLLSSNKNLLKAILNRTLIFIASFITFRYYQKLFVDLGMAVIAIGIGWSIFQAIMFWLNQKITEVFKDYPLPRRIDFLNIIFTVSLGLFVAIYFTALGRYYILFILFVLAHVVETLRNPLFADMFNKNFKSFNRSTALSLSNFLKSVLDIPMIFFAGWLVGLDMIYPYIFATIVGVGVILSVGLHGLGLYKPKQAVKT